MFSDSSPVPGRAGDTEHERVDELMLVLVIRRVTAHQGLGDRLSDKTNVVFTYLDIYNICGQGCESNTKKWSCGCGHSRGYSITLNELDICNVPTGRLSDLDTRDCLSGSTTTKCVTS
jgi:hypothetical protein